MWKLYALSMFARILKNPSKAHFTVLDRQSPVAGLQLIRDFALTNDLLCVWGENFCNLCWCSVSQRPESDGSTASVSDPGQSDWMTPGSGTRCWRTAAVHIACSREMLHDSYLATDGRIEQAVAVWARCSLCFCWVASVRVNSDFSSVRIARGDVKAGGPGNGARVYFVRCHWWQTAEWSKVQWNEAKFFPSVSAEISFPHRSRFPASTCTTKYINNVLIRWFYWKTSLNIELNSV